jgi:tetratricopeptide (TPR) repeat protein
LALAELENVKEPSFEILEKMASIYQKTGNNTKAIEFYSKTFQLQPSDKVKEQLGKSYQFSGNSDQAIKIYNEVLQTNPDNLLLIYNLAKLYMSEKKVKKGIELFKELSKKDTLNPNYQYQLGIAYEKLGQSGFLDSGNSFLKAYNIDSLHLKSIYNLAKFYRKLNFKDSTTLYINKGLEINPMYGLVYLNMKDYKKAEEYFKIAQKKDFKDASVAYNLGLVYKELKDFKKAEYSFAMSIYFQKPKLDKTYYQLGLMQLKQNETKSAIRSFQEGYKNNHLNAILLFQLAMTEDDYYKDKKIALQRFEKYIDKFSDKDKESALYAKQRIKEIKTVLFMNREKGN